MKDSIRAFKTQPIEEHDSFTNLKYFLISQMKKNYMHVKTMQMKNMETITSCYFVQRDSGDSNDC